MICYEIENLELTDSQPSNLETKVDRLPFAEKIIICFRFLQQKLNLSDL